MQFQKGAASFCVCARALQIGPLLRNMQRVRGLMKCGALRNLNKYKYAKNTDLHSSCISK